MLNKNLTYYENEFTNEITTDKWLADLWAEVDHVNVVFWRWSEVCGQWLDFMVREA